MSERLTEDELAEIRAALSGRTKYVGRRVPWDERLLAEVLALREENTRLLALADAFRDRMLGMVMLLPKGDPDATAFDALDAELDELRPHPEEGAHDGR